MCTTPWTHPTQGPIKCGQCVECRLAYSREWAVRMVHEQQSHKMSCMVTLTYDDEHLPKHGQLHKHHLQRFFKYCRKDGLKFKYVACGEYGETNFRPHFHVAFYGVDFSEDRIHYSFAKGGDKTYRSKRLSRLWTCGYHDIGTLNFESAAYIARYIMKKQKGPGAQHRVISDYDPDTGEFVVANPEFLCASKGIGAAWFDKYFITDCFYRAAVVMNGKSVPVPRYYKDRLKVGHGAQSALRMSQVAAARADLEVEQRNFELNPIRKLARSGVALSRANRYKRDVNHG